MGEESNREKGPESSPGKETKAGEERRPVVWEEKSMQQEQTVDITAQTQLWETGAQESEEQKNHRAQLFSMMLVPTLIYGLLFTILLYDNFAGITMPVFVLVTIGYCLYLLAKFRKTKLKGLRLKPLTIFCMVGMFALAVSVCMTGNYVVIGMNLAGIFLLLVSMLLSEICNTEKWTLAKGLTAISETVFGAVGSVGEPFRDLICFRKKKEKQKNSRFLYVMLGIVCGLPVLGTVLGLLCQADAVFAGILGDLWKVNWHISGAVKVVLFFVYGVFAAYCGIRFLEKGKIASESKDLRRLEPVIANTMLVMLSVIYLVFSFVQIFSLFFRQMRLPQGYTYAEYAREGFFQLLFVCIISVLLVLFFMGCFRENRIKRILLTVICGCTYLMIASSAFRMCLYIHFYHLTFLRVFVLWMLVLLGILLAGILVQMYRETFPLFWYTVVAVTCCVFLFGILRPDYWIAKYDLEHMEQSEVEREENYDYFSALSSDAAPVIAKYEGEWTQNYWWSVQYEMQDGLRKYNISREKARKLMEDQEILSEREWE